MGKNFLGVGIDDFTQWRSFKFVLRDHFEVHSILNILAGTFIGYLGLSHNFISKAFCQCSTIAGSQFNRIR
jgi:hypothetical protein